MGDSNLSAADLIDKIQYAINNTDTTVATYLLSWLNDVYFDVLNSSQEWPFAQKEGNEVLAFTSASAEATLPSDFKSTIMVYDKTNNKPYYRTELWKIRKNDPNIDSTSTSPDQYYFPDEEGPSQTIGIYPKLTSGSTLLLSIVYQREITVLTDASDSYPIIPNRYRANVLIPGVIASYYRWKGLFDQASLYDSKYQVAISKMMMAEGVIKSKPDEDMRWRWDDYFDTEEYL